MSFLRLLMALVTVSCMLIGSSNAEAAFEKVKGFQGGSKLPGIVVCEVKCFGENALRQEFFYTFEELLEEQLHKCKKFRVEQRMMVDPVLDDGTTLRLDPFFDKLHMHAIVNGKEFEPEKANAELFNYYRSQTTKKHGEQQVYYINDELKNRVQELGRKQGVDYLLFCNLKSVEVKETDGGALALLADSSEGKKVSMDMDFYLINAKTGKVFEGTSFTDKSSSKIALPFMSYGKTMTVEQMVQNVLETQAKRTVAIIVKTGLKEVAENGKR